jgi:quinoprotein glucose dehydrogenase
MRFLRLNFQSYVLHINYYIILISKISPKLLFLKVKAVIKVIAFYATISACLINFACHSEKDDTKEALAKNDYSTWQHYLGDQGRTHYSSLDQININNISKLEVAWTYHSGDPDPQSYIQCNPLIIDDMLYGTSPKLKVFALNASTGEEIWKFDPFAGTEGKGFTRGLSYWEEEGDKRILFSAERYLYALDAETGMLIDNFGDGGKVDLTYGLDWDRKGMTYINRSPGTIYKNLIIMGSLNSESLPSAPGQIRAFDVLTGEQKWIFHTIPQPGQDGFETWEDTTAYRFIGGANNWTGMTLDEERGIIYVPTGSAAFDFYGGNRKGANLFANSLIAIVAETGKRIWHFQAVHHDIWDRDLPAPPTLVTIDHEGKRVDAVAQITKSGHVYVFDRETGEPLFPVEEKPYPKSDLIGEQAWPTQPLPIKPPPFARQMMTEADINPFSRQKDSLLRVLKKSRSAGQFVPPSLEGSVIFPGFDGGGEWGGAAWDPETGLLYVNANEMPWIMTMLEIKNEQEGDLVAKGKNIFQSNCMACHGANLQGSNFHGNAPSLVNLNERMNERDVNKVISNGKGSMPSFAYLTGGQIEAVVSFLLGKETKQLEELVNDSISQLLPYGFAGYKRFVDGDGYPAVKPPWGTLNAIDLNKGEIAWQVPLGEYEELTKKGIPITGTENYGGPIVTAGGLLFIGATKDSFFRAFDKNTGKEIWKYRLPAAGMATPSTYKVNGKQYIVIAAGGGKNVKTRGDAYVAFALPD